MESLKDAKKQRRGKERKGRNKKNKVNFDNGPGNKLGEDELTLIFSLNSYWISTNDLLNFRFVNKSWRDAATTTLLRRDACKVALKVKLSIVKKNDDDDNEIGSSEDESFIHNHGDKTEILSDLRQLTELISKSPKFPASCFEIHTGYSCLPDYAANQDLMLFFELHGRKIKTICPHGDISWDLVQAICLTYAPELECLDLKKTHASLGDCITDDDEGSPPKSNLKNLPFKTLALPDYVPDDNSPASDLVHFLLSPTSKLLNLTNVNVTIYLLAHVLKEGKGNLVKSFVFPCWEAPSGSISLLNTFRGLSPKLSKLNLELPTSREALDQRMAAFNGIISSSRGSLQVLKLSYYLDEVEVLWEKLNIPPMQNLKSLTLSGTHEDNRPDIPTPDIEDLRHPFKFEKGFQCHQYFPSLLSFKLKFGYGTLLATPASYVRHFPKNSCSNVDTLEICGVERENLENVELDYTRYFKVFPNVRVLKFGCGTILNLSGTLWKMCSLEFIEIYGISKNLNSLANAASSSVLFVDQFFTGFSIDMCHKLQTKRLPKKIDIPVTLKFLQIKPSIRDLQNVKELKLKFSADFSGQFASRVTAEYAFSKIPDARFIVFYEKFNRSGDESDGDNVNEDQFGENESDEDNDEMEEYEEMCFGPIKPYVHIIREKKHY